MHVQTGYTLRHDLDDDLNVTLTPKVKVRTKAPATRTFFTHYQDRYTYMSGVLLNNDYLSD
jgi:hypothetical protein